MKSSDLLRALIAGGNPQGCGDPSCHACSGGEAHPTIDPEIRAVDLKNRLEQLNEHHVFVSGDLVEFKDGLASHNMLIPMIVVEKLNKPVYRSSDEGSYFGMPYDIIVSDGDKGFPMYHLDSRRLQPWKK